MAHIIRIQRVYKNIPFNDSLVLPDDHGKTPEEIAQIMEQRFQQWIYNRENPATDEPVVE
jgi:hypothetical protein